MIIWKSTSPTKSHSIFKVLRFWGVEYGHLEEGDIHGTDLIKPVNFNLNQLNSIKHNQISRQKKMVGW